MNKNIDLVIGRVLSHDNYVQDATNAQSYNRYSYCLNNPLKYTDPSGNFAFTALAIGAMIGAFANVVIQSWSGKANTPGQIMGAFGIGALAGGASAGVGAGVSSAIAGTGFGAGFVSSSTAASATGFWAGAAVGASSGITSGFTIGAGNSWMQGNSFGTGLLAGLKAGGIGAGSGALTGGLSFGIKASLNHKDFWLGRDDIYKSPISYNYGKENGECVYRSLEEFSRSYGHPECDADYWRNLNGGGLWVRTDGVVDLINKSGVFSSQELPIDINSVIKSISNNERVMVGFSPDINNLKKGHAVMVNRVRLNPNGNYQIWLAETSGKPIAPSSITNFLQLNEIHFFSFSLKH